MPAHYHEVLYWQITQSSWRLTVVNVLSLPVAVLMGLVFFGWAAVLNQMPYNLRFSLAELLLVLPALALTLVLHELLHGLAMAVFSARPRYGIFWQGLMLYATAPGYAFRRNDYMVVILAPLVTLSLAAMAAIILVPPFVAVLLALCATTNGAGAVADLWILGITLRYPARAFVVDERDGMRIFLPNA